MISWYIGAFFGSTLPYLYPIITKTYFQYYAQMRNGKFHLSFIDWHSNWHIRGLGGGGWRHAPLEHGQHDNVRFSVSLFLFYFIGVKARHEGILVGYGGLWIWVWAYMHMLGETCGHGSHMKVGLHGHKLIWKIISYAQV